MDVPAYLSLLPNRRIAYHRSPAEGDGASRPGIVFLGGFRSDMGGTKAMWLERWAANRGLAYLRFDYRGHGQSSGAFEECTLGDWADDAAEAVGRLTEGPQILIGSSMGGWIALLLAQRFAHRLAGLIGIAAAPDFTEEGARERLSAAQQDEMMRTGRIAVPSAYSDEPYVYTRKLFEEARAHLIFTQPLNIACPVRLLHGTADVDVPSSVSVRLLDHITAPDARLTLVKDADHRFSGPEELALIGAALDDIIGR